MDGPLFGQMLNHASEYADALQQAAAAMAEELRQLKKLGGCSGAEQRRPEEYRREEAARPPEPLLDGCLYPGLLLNQSPAMAEVESGPVARMSTSFHSAASAGTDADGVNAPELYEVWRGDANMLAMSMMPTMSRCTRLEKSSTRLSDVVAEGGVGCDGHVCPLCLPTSNMRIAWDTASILVITWDLIVFPLSAFGVDDLYPIWLIGVCISLFWLVNIPMGFLAAFTRPDGLVESRYWPIAKRYLSTWFVFDLGLVTVDAVTLLINEDDDVLSSGKVWRTVRIMKALRVLRLVRAAKFLVLFDHLASTTFSKPLATFMSILRMLAEIGFLSHFVACAWYAIGSVSTDSTGWVAPYVNLSGGHLYLLSFHWTIAQFTPAPTNVMATNFEERLFATLVLFVGIVVFSSLIGRVNAIVVRRQQEASEEMLNSERLRRLCNDRGISTSLANRVMRFLNTRPTSSRKQWVVEDDITCLRLMPKDLLAELRTAMYSKALVLHPLFSLLKDARPVALFELCHSAVRETRTAVGETVFRCDTSSAGLHIVVTGSFEYGEGDAPRMVGFQDSGCSKVSRGEFLCEGALWLPWEHRGVLIASTPGSLMVLQAETFRIAMGAQRNVMQLFRKYAGCFAQRLQAASEEAPVTDLWRAFDGEEDLCAILWETAPQEAPAAPAPEEVTGARLVSQVVPEASVRV